MLLFGSSVYQIVVVRKASSVYIYLLDHVDWYHAKVMKLGIFPNQKKGNFLQECCFYLGAVTKTYVVNQNELIITSQEVNILVKTNFYLSNHLNIQIGMQL